MDVQRRAGAGGRVRGQRASPPRARGEEPGLGAAGDRQRGPAGPGVPQPAGQRRPGHARGRAPSATRSGSASAPGRQGHVVDRGARTPAWASRPKVLPRIFDPFFTTKPAGEGTGLGLSICHAIVHRPGRWHPGESQVGVGSTFRVVLPAGTAESARGRAPPGAGGRRRPAGPHPGARRRGAGGPLHPPCAQRGSQRDLRGQCARGAGPDRPVGPLRRRAVPIS